MKFVQMASSHERDHGVIYLHRSDSVPATVVPIRIEDSGPYSCLFSNNDLSLWEINNLIGIGYMDERGLVINVSSTLGIHPFMPIRYGDPVVQVEQIKVMKVGPSYDRLELSGKMVSLIDCDDHILVSAGFETQADYLEWSLKQ